MSRRQPVKSEGAWRKKYAYMTATAEEALAVVRPGQRVYVESGCALPQALVRALVARAPELWDVEIVELLAIGTAPYAAPELEAHFRVNSFFLGEEVRPVVQEGLGDYTPIFLSDIPALFHSGRLPLDVALIHVAPPDERGMCSLGPSVAITRSAAENASLVIAQVNERLPRTRGHSNLHVHDLDVLVPADEPLIEFQVPEPDEETRKIAEHVVALVDDGATVELGIGRIPHAVATFLKTKRDLGIHTEMFTDALIDLIEGGVVTGARKTADRGKIVASFCLGTERLYDYIRDNPVFSFQPTEYVNDPFVIARQSKMVAINVALEVDLTGQVCADSLGTRFFSGIGGQVDFNRGAARSKGGKAIIVLPSTARDGTVSRIVSRLSPGAGVVTSRGDVHYVATEYGVAYLHGKSIRERALALIGIAHPDWRERLVHEAIEANYLPRDLEDFEGKIRVGPKDVRASLILDDGTEVRFRSIQPTDEPRLQHLFYGLSEDSIRKRFLSFMKRLPKKYIQRFVYIDHRGEVALVATVPEAHGDEIIAIGHYFLDPATNRAEVAFVVGEKWQGKGIGTYLLEQLIRIAKRDGIAGFTAEVLDENKGMQTVLDRAPCQVRSRASQGVYHYELEFV